MTFRAVEKIYRRYDTYNGPQTAENLHLPDLDLFSDIRLLFQRTWVQIPSTNVAAHSYL